MNQKFNARIENRILASDYSLHNHLIKIETII